MYQLAAYYMRQRGSLLSSAWIKLNKKGFTLIELLVVVAIIGLLATLSILGLNSARIQARDAKRKADISQIQKALEMYYNDYGKYPRSGGAVNGPNGGWSNSTDASWDTGVLAIDLRPYLNRLPDDPLNTPGWARDTDIYSYSYATCYRGYMLVYRFERDTSVISKTVVFCGPAYNYGNGSITTGIDSAY